MKVLLINTSDIIGGAAVAANRLLHALNDSGIEAKMLVKFKSSDDKRVVSIGDSFLSSFFKWLRFISERLLIFVANQFSKKNLFAVSIANTGFDISVFDAVKDADVIHIHWINQGFLSLSDINKISGLGKPIIWTMHDMWPFTSVCHYAGDCNEYHNKCIKCNMLDSNCLVQRTFDNKFKLYSNTNMTFVGCSNWISNLAKSSSLIKDKPIFSVPNTIDINKFKRIDKKEAKRKVGFDINKTHILFISQKVTDERKGVMYFVEAMNIIKSNYPEKSKNIEVVMLGKNSNQIQLQIPFKTHAIGYVSDEKKIIDIYNAIDVYVTPSMQDNLPNTIMEAMACGVPCVGFNIGGVPELINHGINGFIAEPKNVDSLAEGIISVLSEDIYKNYSDNCVSKVASEYSYSVIVSKYLEIYKNALKNNDL